MAVKRLEWSHAVQSCSFDTMVARRSFFVINPIARSQCRAGGGVNITPWILKKQKQWGRGYGAIRWTGRNAKPHKHSINTHQHDRYLVTIIKGVVARTSKREHHRGRAGPLSPGALGRPFASPARNYSYTDPPSA